MQEVENKTPAKLADVIVLTDNLITINKTQYKIVENHDNGFNEERIEERYNDVLDKYDFIVGDWGYDQLRFKGFYEDERRDSTLDSRISHLEDYLLEYCNFGCAYFVLEKVKKAPLKNRRKGNHRFHTRSTQNKHGNNNKNVNKNTSHRRRTTTKHRVKKTSAKKTFKIRKIGEKNK
ncbi:MULTISPECIES: YutD family protein [unclassified Companilactobacillus]|uniref:YutD family protein n=1 Tax=unclassified Companilactobacillus TaxID=2767904 RepID=UPI002FF00F88